MLLLRFFVVMVGVGSKLYIFGGLSRDCGWLNDFYVFDIGMILKILVVFKWVVLFLTVLFLIENKYWNK